MSIEKQILQHPVNFYKMGERNEKVLLYFDNSNLFYPTQAKAIEEGRRNGINYKPNVKLDLRARINYNALYEIVLDGRQLLKKAALYGSTPPPSDALWKKIEGQEIDVSKYERSRFNNKEKRVDTALTADAVLDMALTEKETGTKYTIIICTGDLDVLPVVEKAIFLEFNVEIWSYSTALAEGLEAYHGISIRYIDDVFERVCFIEKTWKCEIRKDRTMVLSFQSNSSPNEEIARKLRNALENVVDIATNFYGQPMQSVKLERHHPENPISVGLYPVLAPDFKSKDETKHPSFQYDFEKDVFSKVGELRKLLPMCNSIMRYSTFISKYPPPIETVRVQGIVEEVGYSSSEDNGFTKTTRKKEKKPRCKNGFRCPDENDEAICGGRHSLKEKEFFKRGLDKKSRRYYKMVKCIKINCLFMDKTYLCSFAHGVKESYCINCKASESHFTTDCPNK